MGVCDVMYPAVPDVLMGPKRCDCNWDLQGQDVFSGEHQIKALGSV